MTRYALEYECEDCGAKGIARGTHREVYDELDRFKRQHGDMGHRLIGWVEQYEEDYLREHPDLAD